ncbi:MAG: hypothetical protein ACN6O8_14465 [Achromobacter sp.]|uniref:hypothetical protein n=1 Tax=Achromobacter sp. TaxID=134375 RepID=UPI003D033E04
MLLSPPASLPSIFPPQSAFESFRHALLSTLCALRRARPDTRLLVLYDPALGDPLGVLHDERRATTLLRHGAGAGVAPPRLIELDCHKTAPYLFETDAGLDDPCFEASLTQAYRYAQAGPLGLPDDPGRACGGWIVTADSGHAVAQRFAAASLDLAAPVDHRHRWHDPRALAHIWDSLSASQRTTLLGDDLIWLALDAQGRLRTFQGGAQGAPTSRPGSLTLTPEQRARARQTGQVNRLLATWQSQQAHLPPDAAARLHRRLAHPLASRLDGPDRAAFALATAELDDSFAKDPRWQRAILGLPGRGTLAESLRQLPRQAWTDNAVARPSRPEPRA